MSPASRQRASTAGPPGTASAQARRRAMSTSSGFTDAFWYLARGTGVMCLVLLTVVVALGIATRSGRPLPGLPRFAVAAVHRSASLLAVTLLALHVGTLLLDPYAQLKLLNVVARCWLSASCGVRGSRTSPSARKANTAS